jgi:hypothetical protein
MSINQLQKNEPQKVLQTWRRTNGCTEQGLLMSDNQLFKKTFMSSFSGHQQSAKDLEEDHCLDAKGLVSIKYTLNKKKNSRK